MMRILTILKNDPAFDFNVTCTLDNAHEKECKTYKRCTIRDLTNSDPFSLNNISSSEI